MELIIKIDKELYEAYKGKPPMLGDAGMDMIAQAIANGTPYNPSGDLISREALKAEFKRSANRVRNWKEGALNNGNDESAIRADAVLAYLTEVKGIIDNAQAVEPKRPQGKWIKTPDLFRDRICSNCKQQIPYSKLGKFCVECGADMRKGGNE